MKSESLLLLLFSPLTVLAQYGRGQRISTDATCGGVRGYACLDSAFGNCCSQYGWCGRGSAYCGAGCNRNFGSCNGVKPSSTSSKRTSSTSYQRSASTLSTRASSASSTPTQQVTTNARCGKAFGGRTCLGSQWGDCCSQYSYCGSTIDYCDAKTCQNGFGKCNSASSSSSSRLSTSTHSSSSSSTPPQISSISKSSLTSAETTTAVPEPASSTSESSSAPPAPSHTCGVKATFVQGNVVVRDASNDYAHCRAQCLANPSCLTYATIPSGAIGCVGYDTPIAIGARLSPTSPGSFYERDCPDPSEAISTSGSSIPTSTSSSNVPAQTCGVKATFVEGAVVVRDTSNDLDSCRALCQSAPACLTYATIPNPNPIGCVGYSTPIRVAIRLDQDSPGVFYERDCAAPLALSSTSLTEAESSSSLVCTTALASTTLETSTAAPTSSPTCGQKGSMRGTVITQEVPSSYDKCRALCLADSSCLSYAVVVTAGGGFGCVTYSTSIEVGFMHNERSPSVLFPRDCPVPTIASSSASKTSSASATSSAATAPDCTSTQAPDCEQFVGDLNTACANGGDRKCAHGYRILCDQIVTAGAYLGQGQNGLTAQQCTDSCTASSSCVASELMSNSFCQKLRQIISKAPIPGQGYVVFERVC